MSKAKRAQYPQWLASDLQATTLESFQFCECRCLNLERLVLEKALMLEKALIRCL